MFGTKEWIVVHIDHIGFHFFPAFYYPDPPSASYVKCFSAIFVLTLEAGSLSLAFIFAYRAHQRVIRLVHLIINLLCVPDLLFNTEEIFNFFSGEPYFWH
jgi:hypothetical protein